MELYKKVVLFFVIIIIIISASRAIWEKLLFERNMRMEFCLCVCVCVCAAFTYSVRRRHRRCRCSLGEREEKEDSPALTIASLTVCAFEAKSFACCWFFERVLEVGSVCGLVSASGLLRPPTPSALALARS